MSPDASSGQECAPQSPPLEVDISPVGGRSRKHSVRVHVDGRAIFADSVNLAEAASRGQFCRATVERAATVHVSVTASEIESALLDYLGEECAQMDDDISIPIEFDGQAVLDAFGIVVLGEQDDQTILAWSTNTTKNYKIKNPDRLGVQELRQILGPAGDDCLWTTDDEPAPAGMYSPADLRRAIALAASAAKRISQANIIGQGIWRRNGRVIVVNGAETLEYNDGTFEHLQTPHFGEDIVQLNASRRWADSEALIAATTTMTRVRAQGLILQLRQLLQCWNWSHRYDDRILSLLMVASFIQACWRWRPQVSVTGPTDCGKSTLFSELLKPFFGRWTIATDRSTEAGLRQAIGHDAAPVLVDEFDRYGHRQQVLELFRTSSRGGLILRGTADQTGQKFGVQHIGWFAAIESGDHWAQDQNRFIHFELLPPARRGALCLPSTEELADLGQNLIAVALWVAARAIRLADRLRATRVPRTDGRIVESFAVPAALEGLIFAGRGNEVEFGQRALRAWLNGRTTTQRQVAQEEQSLLQHLLAATVRVPVRAAGNTTTQERMVGQLLECFRENRELLQAHGVTLIDCRSRPQRLFVVPEVVRSRFLQGTRWADSRIDTLLLRLPGADREQQRCGGASQRPWGVSLPWPLPGSNGGDEAACE